MHSVFRQIKNCDAHHRLIFSAVAAVSAKLIFSGCSAITLTAIHSENNKLIIFFIIKIACNKIISTFSSINTGSQS